MTATMTTTTRVVLFWTYVFVALVAPVTAWSQDGLTPQQRRATTSRPQFLSSQRELSSATNVDKNNIDAPQHVAAATTTATYPSLSNPCDDIATTTKSSSLSSSSSSRRNLFRCTAAALATPGILWGYSDAASAAYIITKAEPDEKDIYRMAQDQQITGRPLKVLWIGSGAFAMKTGGAARSGVYKDLFRPGTEVTAVDLLTPTQDNLRDAQTFATEQGGFRLDFQRGDATKLGFGDESFDAVVCSLFLCQDFDPVVVVKEIRRVLKPGGRFGFYEHIEDIDKVVVGKVFGDRSVLKVEADPYLCNILAGVVKKV